MIHNQLYLKYFHGFSPLPALPGQLTMVNGHRYPPPDTAHAQHIPGLHYPYPAALLRLYS